MYPQGQCDGQTQTLLNPSINCVVEGDEKEKVR